MSYYYAPVGNRSTYSNSRNNNILSPYKSYSLAPSGVSLDTLIGGVWSNVLYPSLKGLSKMIVPAGKATFNIFKPVIAKAVKTSIPIAKRVTAWCAKTFKEKALPKKTRRNRRLHTEFWRAIILLIPWISLKSVLISLLPMILLL